MNFGGVVHVNKTGICILGVCFVILILYIAKNLDLGNTDNNEDLRSNDINIRKLLVSAIALAEKGGQEVTKVKEEHIYKIKSKALSNEAYDPVTEADYHSHCVMYYGFKKIFPRLQIVSEEDRSEKDCGELLSGVNSNLVPTGIGNNGLIEEELPNNDISVWIDPLDATQEFTENLLEFVTTLVCVAYKGRPIIGVIHRPFGQAPKTSWAWMGKEVSPDLKHSKKPNPAIIVSRSHTGPVEKLLHDALGNDIIITKAGGAGYKVMQLINGNASAYIHSNKIKKWDICAGNAILNAVGGQMTTLKNEDLDYSFNADPVNLDGLIATLKDHDYYAQKLEKFVGANVAQIVKN